MEVRELPTVFDWPQSNDKAGEDGFGQFVVLALDRVASVAELEDDTVLEEALKLPHNRYLAMVMADASIFREAADGEYRLAFQFYLVCRGFPADCPSECVPLAPATENPLNREPLRTTAPLPWEDLYISTTTVFEALVSRVHHGRGFFPALLDPDARYELIGYKDDDMTSRQQRKWDANPALAPKPLPRPAPPVKRRNSLDDTSESSDAKSHHSEHDPVKDALLKVYEKTAMVEKHVEIWLDIEAECRSSDLLVPPHLLTESLIELRKIWKRWEEGAVAEILAKRPQTNAWINGVEPGLAEDLKSRSVESLHKPADDDQDRPEDRAKLEVPQPGDIGVPEEAPKDAVSNGVASAISPARVEPAGPPLKRRRLSTYAGAAVSAVTRLSRRAGRFFLRRPASQST